MKVITSGSAYLDIDAYAGIIAYAELLNLQGTEAIAVSSAPLNESVTKSIRNLGKAPLTQYESQEMDEFVLIDVSKEIAFDPIVNHGKIAEIIDHHPGHEAHWQSKIGAKADIELIGACCTQIYERWQASGELESMQPETAHMLAAGILDNTLNLQANVTTNRDTAAYRALTKLGSLPVTFAADYFSECQKAIETNVAAALNNEIKEMEEELLPDQWGQLTVWDGKAIVSNQRSVIADVFAMRGADWALDVISISENATYFITDNPITQAKFKYLLGVEFTAGVAMVNRLILRKEILKLSLEMA